MATLYTHQTANIRKTWILFMLFFAVVIAIGWFFSVLYDAPEVLIIAVVFSIITNIVSYWWADTLVVKISGAIPADKRAHWDFYTVTENLSIAAGLPMPKLYVIPDPVPNAFATGRDGKHAAVVVTTGLLELLDRSELEGVVAHELSHIGNRDMLLSTVAVVLVGMIALLSDFFLRMRFWGGRDSDNRASGALVLVGFFLALFAPLVASLMQLAISRKREFLADASGALLTRYPDGLAAALAKMAAYGGPMLRANHATAHLYIANPFGAKGARGFLNTLFSTHPPIEERIAALRGASK